jgi:hypothetical protein
VQVGNGMSSYYSEEYKFQLDYESRFKLEVLSQSNLMFYNNVSKMEVKISNPPPAVTNEAQLKSYLEKISKPKIIPLKLGEASGYASEDEYYILSPKKELIYAHIESKDAESQSKLHQIISTLVFDYQKPQINKMSVSETKVIPGKSIVLNFVFDEKKIGLNGNIYGHLKGVAIKVQEKCYKELNFEMALEKIAENKYTASLEIPHNMCIGQYEIAQFFVSDKVGNTLNLELAKKIYAGSQYRLEKISIEVLPFEKKVAPALKVKSLKLGDRSAKAGGAAQLQFTLENDRVSDSVNYFMRFRPQKRINNNDSKIEQTGRINVQAGTNVIKIEIPLFLWPGLYELEHFNLYDSLGNKLNLSAKDNEALFEHTKMFVDSDLEKDTVAPLVTELKAVNKSWHKLSFNRIYFKATEVGSGLRMKREYKGIFLKVDKITGQIIAGSAFPLISHIIRDRSNQYYIEFFVPENVTSGTYALSSFIIHDNAGNKTALKSDGTQSFYESHQIEVLKINIE